MSALDLLWLCVALPFAGFAINGLVALVRPGLRAVPAVVGPGAVLAAFGVAAAAVRELAARGDALPPVQVLWPWIHADRLRVDFALQLDQLSAVMLLVVTGVGSLIHLFSLGYMRDDEGFARYFAYLNLFVACMLLLVLGANYPVLFVGWEGVGLCSYLLIGFWYGERKNADAGKKAFITNRIGDFGVLLAMFLLWHALGTLDVRDVAAGAAQALGQGSALATAIALCLFLGCVGKSAQVPLHVWLPDAMAGPTPVSALIHAATMVTAGVYLVARAAPVFALAPTAQAVVAATGAATALFAATIAVRQHDIKKVLAFSTVSQLGYMFVGVATGAYAAGVFHLVTHAFFKALLFLGAGSVIHALHHAQHAGHVHGDAQDLRRMGGLRAAMPWTAALMLLAALAIAGVPPLAGFWSKDEILAAAFARGAAGEPVFYLAYGACVLAALLTAAYMARLVALAFFGTSRVDAAAAPHLHEAPWVMTGPLVVLGGLTVAGGLLNLPAWAGGHHALAAWLEPVFAPARQVAAEPALAHHLEAPLVAVAVGVGLLGFVLGWRGAIARPLGGGIPESLGIDGLMERKFLVDEAYDALLIRPLRTFSREVLWRTIDRKVLDGFGVHGLAKLAQGAGWAGSRLQTGQVGMYVIMFLLGAVLVLRTVLG
ncbi:MAG: NADH-quinone oxidoreductase subunit L [Gemmatimonadales bacterium]|nr:NADH-quinone oxidoreductase subunit L [Gemmatimonadales bacterium]